MAPKEILDRTRQMIAEHAEGDPDKWWYANRFIFARLQLDERKTKSSVKRKLLESGVPCQGCSKPFETRRDVHLHRLNGDKAYSEANCVLMHPDCHRAAHATLAEAAEILTGREPAVTKWSKRYDDKPFLYWWDIAPPMAAALGDLDAIEFAKKDTAERSVVPIEALKFFDSGSPDYTRPR